MAGQLQLALLGGADVRQDGQPVTGFYSSKAQALLYYLAVTAKAQSRATLAGLLWSNMPEEDARTSLRQVLTNLRRVVGPYLTITRQMVAFNCDSAYWLDVEAFQVGMDGAADEAETEQLQEAVKLYQGDFLAGFYVRDAPLFEEWVLAQRATLREAALQALHKLVAQYARRRDYENGIAAARRLLDLEPWHEEVHRQLMLLLAHSDQRSAALAQYKTCRQVLADELSIEPAAETVALFNRIRTAQRTVRHNLPAQATPFVGREPELARISEQLADPTCRLLTLVGLGGIGKTRLALQVAAELANDFLHGVRFIPLASISTPEIMISAIANAFQLTLSGQEEPKMRLLNYLQGREMLLVLDNFEHLLPGASLVTEILSYAPEVKILVTSRERLNLNAEWVVDVPGLALPMNGSETPVSDYSAVQLFCQSANRVQANFSANVANSPAIVRICQLVEGLPLAIELAAASVRVLSPEEIAEEIQRGLDLLRTKHLDVPKRHRSLRAVFERSWRLLSVTEQEIFKKLSLFQGGFLRVAAEEIANVTLNELISLVDKSFLRRSDSGRFEIHELMRQFAADKLRDRDGAGHNQTPNESEVAIYRHHGHYYLTYVAEHEESLHGETPHVASALLQVEMDNIRQAWRWAVEHHEWALLDQSLEAWGKFHDLAGLWEEARMWLDLALNHLRQGQTSAADGREALLLQGRLLVQAAEHAVRQADYEQAIKMAEDAHALATEYEAPDLQGRAQAIVGWVYQIQREYDSALAYQQGAYQLLRQGQNRRQLARLLLQMGNVYRDQHNWAKAIELQREGLQLFQELGDRRGVAMSLGEMSSVHYMVGNLAQALQCSQQALDLARRLQTKYEIAAYTAEIGKVYWRTRQYDEALRYLLEAVALAEELGLKHGLATYNRIIGEIYRQEGNFREARFYLEQALQFAHEAGTAVQMATTLGGLAWLNANEGNYQAALEQYEKALPLVKELGEKRLTANYRGLVGLFHYKLGRYDTARQQLEQSVRELKALGITPNFPALPNRLMNLAEVLYHLSDYALAEAKCREALEIIGNDADLMFSGKKIMLQTNFILAKCCYAQGRQNEASQQLVELLSAAEDDEDRAMLYDTLWQVTRDKSHVETALNLYRKLYARAPRSRYRERIEVLQQSLQITGPAMPAL